MNKKKLNKNFMKATNLNTTISDSESQMIVKGNSISKKRQEIIVN